MPGAGTGGPQVPQATLCLANRSRNRVRRVSGLVQRAVDSSTETADMVVGQVAGADLEPPRVSNAAIGTNVLLQQVLTNVGNGTDSFVVAATSFSGSSSSPLIAVGSLA